MKVLAFLAMAMALAPGPSPFHLDLSRLFPNDANEQTERAALLTGVDVFIKQPASSLITPQTLLDWFSTYDSLSKDLQRHDTYVYLRAEENSDDPADAAADSALSEVIVTVDSAVQKTLVALGPAALASLLTHNSALAPYDYFIDSALKRPARSKDSERAIRLLAQPPLESLGNSYKALRQQGRQRSVSSQPQNSPKQIFEARFTPYAENETAFAALLVPVVSLENGKAQLEGFANGPEAAYFRANLSAAEVNGVLALLRQSDSYKRYVAVVTAAAAQQLHVEPAQLHAWDLDAADTYQAPMVAFPNALPIVLAAEQPMGAEYAGQYARLLNATNSRVEWCQSDKCDDTGFSVGYAGMTSGLFYGAYRGTTDNIRALAHEAGHAVHRQFMNENQALAVYNSGPHFMFESFAIFNELLLLDHLYRTAPSPAARAYYLRQFLEDATHQVFGSAGEVDLEQSIYAGVQNGVIRKASDLDALTISVFSNYMGAPTLAPEMKVYWAANRFYFTDPLYNVNYLFAGLLALQYLQQFESNPKAFSHRYIGLLKNGFTDTPQALELKFLNIDLDDADGMVGAAVKLIDKRSSVLGTLYSGCQQAATCRGR